MVTMRTIHHTMLLSALALPAAAFMAPAAMAAQGAQAAEVVNPLATEFLNGKQGHSLLSVLVTAGVIDSKRAQQIMAARLVCTKKLEQGEVSFATGDDGRDIIYICDDDAGAIDWALLWLDNSEYAPENLRVDDLKEYVYVATASVYALVDLALYLKNQQVSPEDIRNLNPHFVKGVQLCVSASLLNLLHKQSRQVRSFVAQSKGLHREEAQENQMSALFMEDHGKTYARWAPYRELGHVYQMDYTGLDVKHLSSVFAMGGNSPLVQILSGVPSSGRKITESLASYGQCPNKIVINGTGYDFDVLLAEMRILKKQQLNELFFQMMDGEARKAVLAGLADKVCDLLIAANPGLRRDIASGRYSRQEITRDIQITFHESGELYSSDASKRNASGALPAVSMQGGYNGKTKTSLLHICVDSFLDPAEKLYAKVAHELMGHSFIRRYNFDEIFTVERKTTGFEEVRKSDTRMVLEEGLCVVVEAMAYTQYSNSGKGVTQNDVLAYFRNTYAAKYGNNPKIIQKYRTGLVEVLTHDKLIIRNNGTIGLNFEAIGEAFSDFKD